MLTETETVNVVKDMYVKRKRVSGRPKKDDMRS